MWSPSQSYLFWFRSFVPGNGSSGDRDSDSVKHRVIVVSRALYSILENVRDAKLISRLVVPISAAGLQGEQPLVDRIM